MTLLREVPVSFRAPDRLEQVIGAERYSRLVSTSATFGSWLGPRTIWNISSTAAGGGVAEMLQTSVAYTAALGIRVRWVVIGGDPEFFAATKQLHNQLHGHDHGDSLIGVPAAHYAQVLAANADELLGLLRPGDIALLHDPQTAGLTAPLVKAGVRVVWRCHVGADVQNETSRAAWEFLRPHLTGARAYVFSRRQYAPSWIPSRMVWVITPSIDPLSAKNQGLDPASVRAALSTVGVLDGDAPSALAQFTRLDGTTGEVRHAAQVTGERKFSPDDQLIVQVSRWDKLKDMPGVMRGFAEHVAPDGDGCLALVGPASSGVADDPEGPQVFAECKALWAELPAGIRARVLLVSLPLQDLEENAAMVNALQRHAAVVVQKSRAEGFGLTVAEAMWKARPVVGSAVGGIQDQIAEGTGVLLPDPADLATFGVQVRRLLDDPGGANRMALAGQAYAAEHFLVDRHLEQLGELFQTAVID